jgi:hypothetical protein
MHLLELEVTYGKNLYEKNLSDYPFG